MIRWRRLPLPGQLGILAAMDAPSASQSLPPTVVAPRPGRVALLVLHAQAGEDFVGDTAFAWVAGQLRSAGIDATLVHAHYLRGDAAATERLNRELLAAVRGCSLVAVDQAWDERLLAEIQRQGAWLCVTDPFAQWQGLRPELLLTRFERDRPALVALAQAVVRGGDLRAIAGLRADLPGWPAPLATPDPPLSRPPPRLQPFVPATDALVLGEPRNLDGSRPLVRKSLETTAGCPFSDPVPANPRFAGADLGVGGTTLRGCSFCFMGGDYAAPPIEVILQGSVEQVRYWQDHLPVLDEVVLRDQSALRYLPQLVERLQAAELRPAGLLVPGRGDAILRYGAELQRAAELCHNTGWWFTIHLIGFESFSQAQLDLYNKGVTVAEYADALAQMRSLHRQFPDAFRLYAHGGSSLILFNPWTTLEQLAETVEFCDEHAVGALAHGLALSRLRLYPNLPLYWLARRDGLLLDGEGHETSHLSAGYSREAKWRYRDARSEAVELLMQRLAPRTQPDHQVGLLAAALQWARARLGAAPLAELPIGLIEEISLIEAHFCALQRRWRREVGPVEAVAPVAAARTVQLGRTCNQHCHSCVAGRGEFDGDEERLSARVAAAARHGQVVLAGREPALLPGLLRLVRVARQSGARDVEVHSNGRFLANPGVAERMRRAGATRLALKRHRLADADEDAAVAVEGAGSQIDSAFLNAVAAQLKVAAVLVPQRTAWSELPALVEWAVARGAREVRVEVLTAELDFAHLVDAGQWLDRAAQVATEQGVRLEVAGP
ncbi:MAG: hypothetical protein HY902_14010 [Deltaproteobacteria bacterium]|nr:hypothetical protein [Deltaproteobacteria bacterium]